jgi:hypothetical protein
MDEIDGTYACTHPLAGLTGDVLLTRCDPLTPGSCPEGPGAGLPPRLHEIRACTPTPATCSRPTKARARLRVEQDDTFHWKVAFTIPDAPGVTVPDLGDPTTVRDYVACVYHTVGGVPELVGMEPAWAGGLASPCAWTTIPAGVKYRNRSGQVGKLQQVTAKVKATGLSTAAVRGRATTVLTPPPGSTLGLPVVVQLLADDTCYGATFTAATENGPDLLRARYGQ